MREGRIAAKLHHPQLITVYDVIEDDGRPYLVMEYLPSTSLAEVLAERGTLPPQEAARIGAAGRARAGGGARGGRGAPGREARQRPASATTAP